MMDPHKMRFLENHERGKLWALRIAYEGDFRPKALILKNTEEENRNIVIEWPLLGKLLNDLRSKQNANREKKKARKERKEAKQGAPQANEDVLNLRDSDKQELYNTRRSVKRKLYSTADHPDKDIQVLNSPRERWKGF